MSSQLLLVSWITGNLGTGTHFSGNRVNQELMAATPETR
jgi:hypothetical protein